MINLHGLILADRSANELRELVMCRTAASVPFAGRYRLKDFSLSRLQNAGVRDVGVIMQQDYQSLLDHIGSGKEWDMSRKRGGLRLLPPFGRQSGVEVEHYIISSGLQEIILGSRIGDRFKAVFAASFCYDEHGRAEWPATAVNYTSKTQYLFRINKGILDVTNDRDLNAYTPEYKRRVPFSNMIYVGDGLTDVPCMKMTKQKGGYSIAVHAPGETDVADDLLLQGRADFAMEADYSAGSELEQAVTELIHRIRATHDLSLRHARQVRRAYERRGESAPLDIAMRGGLEEEDGAEA